MACRAVKNWGRPNRNRHLMDLMIWQPANALITCNSRLIDIHKMPFCGNFLFNFLARNSGQCFISFYDQQERGHRAGTTLRSLPVGNYVAVASHDAYFLNEWRMLQCNQIRTPNVRPQIVQLWSPCSDQRRRGHEMLTPRLSYDGWWSLRCITNEETPQSPTMNVNGPNACLGNIAFIELSKQ